MPFYSLVPLGPTGLVEDIRERDMSTTSTTPTQKDLLALRHLLVQSCAITPPPQMEGLEPNVGGVTAGGGGGGGGGRGGGKRVSVFSQEALLAV